MDTQDASSSAPKSSGIMTGLLWFVAVVALIIAVIAMILVFAMKPKPAPPAPLPVVTTNVSSAQNGTVSIAVTKTNVYRFNGVIPAASNINVAITGAPASGSARLFFILNDASGSTEHAPGTTPPTGGYLRLADATGGFYYLARGEVASCLSNTPTSYVIVSSTGKSLTT